MRLAAVGILAVCTGDGCTQGAFTCSDAADCVVMGFQGICASGHCAFPDEDCESGWKYGELAPAGIAGTCAEGVMGTSSGVGVSSEPGTGDATSSTTMPPGDAGTTSSSSSPVDPTSVETSSGFMTSTGPADASSSSGGNTSLVTEVWGDAGDSDHPGTVVDTWININTENHISNAELRVYTWPAQMISNVILMQWDVSALAGVEVQSATVVLQVLGKEGMSEEPTLELPLQGIVGVHPNLSEATGLQYAEDASWTPNMCCYTGIPMAQADLGPVIDVVGVSLDLTEVAWDATELVRGWVDSPDDNHGMAISGDADAVADADRIFASSEHPDAALRPRLVVSYAAR